MSKLRCNPECTGSKHTLVCPVWLGKNRVKQAALAAHRERARKNRPAMTDIQIRALTALRKGPCGPAHLSSLVWPDVKAGRGAAPGTGLVRPMLAVLARLEKKNCVEWFSENDEPVKWRITRQGIGHLESI